MRVLVCPTAFKESLSAARSTAAMAAGVRAALADAEIDAMPLSDGGPGLLDAVEAVRGGARRRFETLGPLGDPLTAETLWPAAGEVVIETSAACGLHLVPPGRRDPMRADTRGVGLLVAHCAAAGAAVVRLGLGGSATVDGGTGMAAALGWRFLDAAGRELAPGGGALERLHRIEPGAPLPVAVTALADVRSPLLGPDGAARRFGPQKGASPADVGTLERGLARLAEVAEPGFGRGVRDLAGAGAAGGLGAGCVLFLGATLAAGAEAVLAWAEFDAALDTADLVVTGEGAWDATGALGKLTAEVLRRARVAAVPAVLACGRIDGPVPANVRAGDGGGRWLDEAGLSDLVRDLILAPG